MPSEDSQAHTYHCIECPNLLADVEERTFIVPSGEDDPMFCPWCANRSVVKDAE